MDKDQTGSVDTDPTSQDDVRETEDDDTLKSSQSSEEEQDASGSDEEEELPEEYRGKSAKEIAEMHQNLQKKLGNWKDTEEKAKAFERLARQRSNPAPVARPKLSQFVTENGEIDVQSYDKAIEQYEQQKDRYSFDQSNRTAQEASDAVRAERDFPFIVSDSTAQKMARGLYVSGEASSLYEAVQMVAESRNSQASIAKQTGAKEKEREIATKIKSKTAGAAGRTGGGDPSPEDFAKWSLADKKAFIERAAKGA